MNDNVFAVEHDVTDNRPRMADRMTADSPDSGEEPGNEMRRGVKLVMDVPIDSRIDGV